MAVDGAALATSCGINGGLCVIFLVAFSFLRVNLLTRRFYAPKRWVGTGCLLVYGGRCATLQSTQASL